VASFKGSCDGVVTPVLGVMTLKNDLLGQMRTEWLQRGTLVAGSIGNGDAPPNDTRDLDLGALNDLYDIVTPARGSRRTQRARTRRDRARPPRRGERSRDPSRPLADAYPGIVSVCRQLRFGDGIVEDPSETVGVALGLASELLTDWAGQSRQYAAPDILSALRGRLRRCYSKRRRPGARLTFRSARRTGGRSLTTARAIAQFSWQSVRPPRPAHLRRVYEGLSLREVAAQDHWRRPRCRKSYSTSLCASSFE